MINNISSFKQLEKKIKNNIFSKVFILCDSNTLKYCVPELFNQVPILTSSEIIEVNPGEESKSFEICLNIWTTFLEQTADKKTLLINLGGGVVCDLGAFCASLYKRGIQFVNIPTSMLAMIDAAIGGKNGINLTHFKNSLGTINQATSIIIHDLFLKTLPKIELKNGLVEAYKIALIADKLFWKKLTSNNLSVKQIIKKSISLKLKIVSEDPTEKGLRKILNFGHTIGHALESVFIKNEQKIMHGEAVYMGMIIETHISFQKKLISNIKFQDITKTLLSCLNFTLLKIELQKLKPYLLNDKKNFDHKIQMVLLKDYGKAGFDYAVSLNEIEEAIIYYNNIAIGK
ncbi:MAG: 3-dehydroquinate synthase [Bacteroidetes bacterium]|nr:3-dehydroquinate synthase [Bacteroidota bacterium]